MRGPMKKAGEEGRIAAGDHWHDKRRARGTPGTRNAGDGDRTGASRPGRESVWGRSSDGHDHPRNDNAKDQP